MQHLQRQVSRAFTRCRRAKRDWERWRAAAARDSTVGGSCCGSPTSTALRVSEVCRNTARCCAARQHSNIAAATAQPDVVPCPHDVYKTSTCSSRALIMKTRKSW